MKTLILMVIISFTESLSAQTNLVLQPDALSGKDAFVNSYYSTNNYGTDRGLHTSGWTWSSNYGSLRSFLEFDLTAIPIGSNVLSATLSLYNDPTNNIVLTSGEHSSLTSSNESYICPVTSAWDEATVNWDNQPSFNSGNQVILPESTNPNQDYTNIDVTSMVQDMVDNPAQNYGFALRLITEINYAILLFSSSDNPDSSKHPKLEITYQSTASQIELQSSSKELIMITDLLGREVNFQLNTPLIYIYSDGTKEKVMKIEE